LSGDEPITSSFHRFVKLSGLMGRVGASMLGARALDFARRDVSAQAHTGEALLRNATRIVETLGEMKGAAMKVGQMLSLHEGLLPPDVAAILRRLQQEAPKVPFEVMQFEIRGALPDYDRLFESLEPEAFAAASIGQVHRARLRDGRHVAVKIQYPLIEEIIRADLSNMRTLLQALFSMVSSVDFEPMWLELRERLLEELDYENEAANMRRMTALHDDVPEIIIPGVVEEASARRVLTMEYVDGIPPQQACSERYAAELRNRWGVALFEFQFRGLLEHHLLHADPNLANFAFREDGRVVVYDFGCIKRIPEQLAAGYAAILRAAIDGRPEEIPRLLFDLGVSKGDEPLSTDLTTPYFELFAEVLREDPPYSFGENENLYRELFDLGMASLPHAMDIRFPRDIVFVHRTLGGHFGNLSRLGATARWRNLLAGLLTA
jgi:predicted unusual protein kinase regulating ubiquinone biosynthesis (AarF/ABC1/UbiB family)